jgi:hypothetical protein
VLAQAGEVPLSDLEKEIRRRELSLRRKLDLQKWLTKYNAMLMEASAEYRLGALIKQIADESGISVPARIVEQLGNPDFAEKHKAEIERILSDGEILKALLPLLDALPNI